MGVQIEELKAVFTAQYSGYLRGVRAVQDAAKNLERNATTAAKRMSDAWRQSQKVFQAAGAEMQKVGTAVNNSLNRMAVAATGIATKAAVSFGQFELTMKRAGAVTRSLGTVDFQRLDEAAKEMGRTTVYSASQAAAAIEQMGLAGLTTNEIITALPGALQLAAAAQVDISQASDIAAKTMRAFGADATELSHINDVLVGTFTKANTDLGQLAEAMKQVAPVSKGMGVSLEDTSAAIAKMSDAGFQGSIAGTALRNILTRLGGATPEATNRLRELGVETLTSEGKMRPFLEILADIEKQGLTSAEVMQIFGQRGGPQMMALLEAGSASLRQFSSDLAESGGIAKDISDPNIDTLWGSFKLLQSELETVTNHLGQQLKPVLEDLFNWIKGNKPVLNDLANQFAMWMRWIMDLITAHPKLTAALVAFKVSGLLGVNQAIVTLISSLAKVSMALTGYVAKVGVAKAASLALQGGLYALAAAAIYFGSTAIYNANKDIQAFNESLQKSKELSDELSQKKSKATSGVIDKATQVGGEKGKSLLQAEIEREKEEMEGLQASIRGQKKVVEELNTTWNSLTGNKILQEEQENLKDLEDKLSSAKARVEQLEAAMKSLGTTSSDAAQEAAEVPGAVEDQAAALVGDGTGVAEAIQDAVLSSMEAKSGCGFKDIRELIQAGATGEQLQEFLNAISTGPVGESNAAFDARRELNAINEGGGFQSQEQLDAFALNVAESLNAAIAAEEQNQALDVEAMDAEKRRLEELKSTLESMKPYANELNTELFQLDEEISGPLLATLEDVQGQFDAGNLSAEDFAETMAYLKKETDKATQAAEKKAQQEIRQRILAGDFSVLNPMQALEDKLFQFRMQQFNQGIDVMFNNMMGLGNAIQPAV